MPVKLPTEHEAKRALVNAAVLWWQRKRRRGWNQATHLRFADVNCLTEQERRLAWRVAQLVEAQQRREVSKDEHATADHVHRHR